MRGEVLFILAGYSGVGKSTLLVNALKNKIPIFGRKWDYLFQATNIPLRLPEQTMTFEEILQRHPRVAINLLHFAAAKLRAVHDRLRELATERAERRVARTVSRLAAQIGRRIEAGVLLDAPLTRQALAELSGTSLFTVSRTLKEWERQGLILAGRERVVIVNTHAMATLADDLPASP